MKRQRPSSSATARMRPIAEVENNLELVIDAVVRGKKGLAAATTAVQDFTDLIAQRPGDMTPHIVHAMMRLERRACAHAMAAAQRNRRTTTCTWTSVAERVRGAVATACQAMGPARSDAEAWALWVHHDGDRYEAVERNLESLDLDRCPPGIHAAHAISCLTARARSSDAKHWHALRRGDLAALRNTPDACMDILQAAATQDRPDITTTGGMATYAIQAIAISARLPIMQEPTRLAAWSSIIIPKHAAWDFRCLDIQDHVLAHVMLDIAGNAWAHPTSPWARCGKTAWDNALVLGLNSDMPTTMEQHWPEPSIWPATVHRYALRQLARSQVDGMNGTIVGARLGRHGGTIQVHAALLPWLSTAPWDAAADEQIRTMSWRDILAQPSIRSHLLNGMATSILGAGLTSTTQARAVQYAMDDHLLGQAGAIAVSRLSP